MSRDSSPTIQPADVLRTLITHRRLLIVPIVAGTLLAVLYGLMRPVSWEATQALIARDETGGSTTVRPGKFTQIDEMKASQETILELVKSRAVLEPALVEVGPPPWRTRRAGWPAVEDVETLRDAVKLTPPKGAEFGKTEVFYLKVQSRSKDRAVALAAAIGRSLQKQFQVLRADRARSMVLELEKSVSLAEADLRESTKVLSVMEQRVGSDLAELRNLNDYPSGDSDLRRESLDVEKDLRTYRATETEQERLLEFLHAARDNPGRLLAAPRSLLQSQPALERLKAGLVDAELRSAQLAGSMTENHPLVKNGREAEQDIGQSMHDEINVALNGVQAELQLTRDRIHELQSQRQSIQQRLTRLAGLRAEYSNLVSVSKHRTEFLKIAQQELAEASASEAGAHTASLITLIDRPETGSRPVGPGFFTILLVGLGGGILTSLAIVFLTVQPSGPPRHVGAPSMAPLQAPVAAWKPASRSSAKPPGSAVPAGRLSFKQALQKLYGDALLN